MSNVYALQEPAVATFEDFWNAYPRPGRKRKPLAKAKWDAIVNGGLRTRTFDRDSNAYVDIELSASPEEIIEAAKAYDRRTRKPGTGQYGYVDEGKYICHATTWLNQGRWMDE